MRTIASNLTTRDPKIGRLFRHILAGCEDDDDDSAVLQDVAQACAGAGADALEINLQQHFDQIEAMEFAVKAVQQSTDLQLCLSSNKADVLEAGLKICRRPPIVNYVSIDVARLKEILPLAVKYKAEVILLISDPASPGDARQMLEKAAILVGAANAAGISNERIILDPGIFHITVEQGQHHLVEVVELLRAVPDTFDPAVGTTCWLSNSSAGAPARLRPVIETALLSMLAGIGLSSVFLDVLRKENMRTVRLLKIFQNEEVYAEGNLV